jgi:hypothetical protein
MMVVMDKVSFYFFPVSNDADWNQATNYDHVPDISRVNFWLRRCVPLTLRLQFASSAYLN